MMPGGRTPLLLGLCALVLFAPGILWGLPHATSPDRIFPWGSDELAPLGPLAQVYHVVLHGGAAFDPRYPLLPYVIQTIFIAPYLAWLRLTGGLTGFTTGYPYGLTDPVAALAGMTLAARISSLLLMSAVPVIAFHTAKRLWNAGTGTLAGLFALLVLPFAFYARTSNVDAGALFWTALALMVFATSLKEGLTTKRAVWLGVFAAAAIATKDQNYAIFLALGIAIVVLHLRDEFRRGAVRTRALRAPLAGLATAVAVYLAASGLILHPHAFLDHVEFILFHPGGTSGQSYYSTPATIAGYLQLIGTYADLLAHSLGLPMTLAAVAGLVVAARRSPRTLLFALPLLAVLLGVILPVRFIRIRFVLPAAYVLALFAAAGVAALAVRLVRVRYGRVLAAGLVVAIAAWSLLRAIDLTYQMRYDSRYALETWLRENVQPGDRIGYYGAALKLPALPGGIITEPGPYEVNRADGSGRPEFIVVIPQQVFETDHEWSLPDERWAELRSGAWEYEPWLALQGPVLLEPRPVNWVNPPVRLFVRRDVIPRLTDRTPRLEID